MLTHARLVKLYRDLADQEVLSVYVNADQHDPALRDAWKTRLERAISDLRRDLARRDGEMEGFERSWAHVAQELKPLEEGFLPHRGWVAFATPDRLWYAEGITARMPDLVRWEEGIRVAPYVRALKQERPVVVALVDSRKVRLFEYVDGEVEELEGLRADTFLGDLTDVGVRKASSRMSGMRGETSTDQAQRSLEVASSRMIKDLAGLLEARAGDYGLVVLGGPQEVVRHVASALPRRFENRVAERYALHLDMSLAEVRNHARSAAGDLSERAHGALVAALADAARSGSLGTLGREDTERALKDGRVDTLLLSRGFIQGNPDFADHCVGHAFSQGADVEEVSGQAGKRLDGEGNGIAARLRFRRSDEAVSLPGGARSSVG
ncbi:MAG: hypothetical protein PVJ02_13350 [Gemmatimonadota bacterium]